MKRRTQYKFQKPLKPARKKAAFGRAMPADRRASSREYFIRKKTFRTKILTAGIFILILLGITSYILFFTSIFQIKHIEVVFVNKKSLLSENEVKNIVYTILNKKYVYLFPQSNLFLFSRSDLIGIIGQDSRIETITLDKKWLPARLILKITESRPVAQLVIYGDGGEYYLNARGQVIIPPSENEFIVVPFVVSEFQISDTTGRGAGKRSFPDGVTGANKVSDARGRKPYGEDSSRALASDYVQSRGDSAQGLTTLEGRHEDAEDFATIYEGRNNLRFTTQNDKKEKDEKNENNKENNAPSFKTIVIINDKEEEITSLPVFYDKTATNLRDQAIITLFKNILDFINNTYFTNSGIHIPIIEIAEEGDIYEIEMTTTEGWQIFINSEVDFTKQLSNLELILKGKISQRELLQYIDLRFGKKIFYKLK
ncbi:hypothetical protein MYX07_01145 [Patescibacteria group bacterium AH-259-L07]|nr:hypothetical protein [Patescibacteria group bacterium AH-259-L07]